MVIFNSYVSLPEGNTKWILVFEMMFIEYIATCWIGAGWTFGYFKAEP